MMLRPVNMQRLLVAAVVLAAACSSPDPTPTPDPLWPEDWASTYTQVRPCRRSIDHDLGYVTIHADAKATSSYEKRDAPFPEGSTILKVEYDDEECTELRGYTVMQRRAKGYDPAGGDWHWQKADVNRVVTIDGKSSSPAADPPTKVDRCVKCHEACGQAPDGFDGTCSAVNAE
ncbi:MAG: hypothetical protein FJ096_04505 [Deltaproteobacteria bacterium]|nr:hypothetical protein [Deltaproteobacteria bacterium]